MCFWLSLFYTQYSISGSRIQAKIPLLNFWSKEEALEWILRNQLGRRNLSDIDRIKIANRYKEVISKRMKERQSEYYGNQHSNVDLWTNNHKSKQEPTTTRKELAKIAGVGEMVLRKGTVILEKGTPEQIERARKGGKIYSPFFGKKDMDKYPEPSRKPTTTRSELAKKRVSRLRDTQTRFLL